MAVTSDAMLKTAVGGETVAKAKSTKLVNINAIVLSIGGLLLLMLGARFYQQLYGVAYGLDSSSAEFEMYWMGLFYAEVAIEVVVAAALWSWLWMSRDRALASLAPEEELRRYIRLLVWLLAYTFAVYWAASFYAEQDGSWHQTVIRDTDFTASHIVIFYLSFPVYIILGVASLMYAMTRLPQFANRVSVPFVLAIVGPFMILPNVGLNEWGHTFWIMEELFTVPLHWGFVVLGWTALALAGLLLQLIHRVVQLLKVPGEAEVEIKD